MALLLIVPAWILVLSVVLAVCVAARRGDQQQEAGAGAVAWAEPPAPSRMPVTRESHQPEQPQRLVGAGGTVG